MGQREGVVNTREVPEETWEEAASGAATRTSVGPPARSPSG